MTTVFKEGDRVQVVDRDAVSADLKSSLFYNHYRGLVGTVQKVYDRTDDVAVTVDNESLPEAISTRHQEMREQMKSKWLESLSEEARNRLSDAEKDFTLRYTILVSPKDLLPSDKAIPQSTPVPALEAAPPSLAESAETDPPRRKTAAEIEAAEEEYLRTRKQDSQ